MPAVIDTFQLATEGVGPGHTTFNFATLGYGFEISVIIVPPAAHGGGTPLEESYNIIVRIKYKGHEWEDTYSISKWFGESVINVLAFYKGFRIIELGVTIKNVLINKVTPFINVFRKKD